LRQSPPKEDVGLTWVWGVVVVGRGAPVRATAGLGDRGSRYATVICDLAPRLGWWAVRYTSVETPWVDAGVSHCLTDDLTSRIVSYSCAYSDFELGWYGGR